MAKKNIEMIGVQKLKMNLEQDLAKIIREFNIKTSFTVTDVNLSYAITKDKAAQDLFDVEVEIKLP